MWLPAVVLTVVIGAPGAGKSTVGALLAGLTGRVFVDADEHAGPSYARVGWSVARLRELAEQVGFTRAHAEFEPALTAAVVDLVAAHPDAVLALGAGHTHLVDPGLFSQVAAALQAADHVVALRPSPDLAASRQVLRARCAASKGHDWQVDGVDWLARWLGDGRDEQLATHVVHTAGEQAPATARRIAALIPAPGTPRQPGCPPEATWASRA